ncbi:hypothetical protein ACVIW3_003077 [Bradyrhizobium diazoefficiens]|jgi:hypothetical protein|uniref:Uncharacterized protein n=1 Tax=Bradyrhizobium diazoefficiens TaxID=1355477 RepID=A0A810AZJ0_9BRAD|nr:hypothetical protein [Bradyrhizobium japonicum]QBP26456.1 hypothetical protein Bdiaspc4_40835 [Bradyrhizobium diazoefficiens]BCE25686.1 hypothetical protein XF1B_83670 [Bradyrhizobium diazoefficiens]BCE51945.1 hypothetical protein XF4B_82940 [Bradyrhizobium diazoefficiens]BCE60678.1 hypothetical protein XF5B_81900 [Bradyrhizobium diazoefficiens]
MRVSPSILPADRLDRDIYLVLADANHNCDQVLFWQILKLMVVTFSMEFFDDGPITYGRGHRARRGKIILGRSGRT